MTSQTIHQVDAARPPAPRRPVAPPLGGADIELGNFILGRTGAGDTCAEAARALLAEIEGVPRPRAEPSLFPVSDDKWDGWDGRGGGDYSSSSDAWRPARGRGYDPLDWGRKYLATNGGAAYIDLDHIEIPLPEVTCARDFVAYWHGMLRVVRRAQVAANGRLRPGERLQVLVNNSDGRGNSYGAHLNFLVTRRTMANLMSRKLHHLLFLAAYQVSSIAFAGQGKVGSENGRRPVTFQLSQRADFFETLVGIQTQYARPLVNARQEHHVGSGDGPPDYGPDREPTPAERWARLHVIFYDANLCHVANYLKFGVMQVVLAMIEQEWVHPGLILEDPLRAVVGWSHDITFTTRMRTLGGQDLTAVEHQFAFLNEARRFVADGRCVVPEVGRLLDLWEDTLAKIQAGDVAALAPRLDWALKLSSIRQAMRQRPGLEWESDPVKYLDHLYASLDPDEGLYWAFERAGAVERVVTEADVERATAEPPGDTRAWARAMLLRAAGAAVDDVNWDSIRFRLDGDDWPVYRTLHLADPRGWDRAAVEPVLRRAARRGRTLDELLDDLGATPAGSRWPARLAASDD